MLDWTRLPIVSTAILSRSLNLLPHWHVKWLKVGSDLCTVSYPVVYFRINSKVLNVANVSPRICSVRIVRPLLYQQNETCSEGLVYDCGYLKPTTWQVILGNWKKYWPQTLTWCLHSLWLVRLSWRVLKGWLRIDEGSCLCQLMTDSWYIAPFVLHRSLRCLISVFSRSLFIVCYWIGISLSLGLVLTFQAEASRLTV